MSEWKDVSSYSRGDKERIPTIWHWVGGTFHISVHRHIHYSETQWLLSAAPFFNKFELPQADIGEAKYEALVLVKRRLEQTIATIDFPTP